MITEFILIWSLSWWILLILFYCYSFRKSKRSLNYSKVLSVCHLPENMTPATLGVINTREFDHRYLTAEIVNLAIMGYITIHREDSLPNLNIMDWWRDDSYTLIRTQMKFEDNNNTPHANYYSRLLQSLFLNSDVIKINHTPELFERYQRLDTSFFFVWKETKKKASDSFISTIPLLLKGLAFSIFPLVSTFYIAQATSIILFEFAMVITALFLLTNYWMTNLLKLYSPAGEHNVKKIVSLVQYMNLKKFYTGAFAEQKVLYEKYLPYSIVLGCYEAWQNRFDKSFKKNYHPTWYTDSSKKFDQVWFDFVDSFDGAIYKNICKRRSSPKYGYGHFCRRYKIF